MFSRKRSKLRRFGFAAIAALAIGVAAAPAAEAFEWEVNGVTFAESGTVSETVNPAIKAGTEFTLESTILGAPFKIHLGKLSGESTVITPGGKASGFLVFSEVTTIEPVGCKITPPIKTKTLKSELVEVGGVLYDKFVPKEGETLFNVTITNCAAAETYPLRGSFFAKTEKLGVQLVTQPLTFSKAINEAAGGTLKFGKEPVVLTGEAVATLTGPNNGKIWGAK